MQIGLVSTTSKVNLDRKFLQCLCLKFHMQVVQQRRLEQHVSTQCETVWHLNNTQACSNSIAAEALRVVLL